MTEIEFKKQLKASKEVIKQFVQLSDNEQQDLKSCILELLVNKNTAFQKQQLILCGLMSFSLKEYVSNFKTLPEYYFIEKQYRNYHPKWFQEYIDGYLKNKNYLKLETIADLINSYNYVFNDNLILNRLIHLDTQHKIEPKAEFEKTVVSLLTKHPKFTKQHIYVLFTENAETYLDEAQSRSLYQGFYIDIDSWIKIIYKLYETIELDKVKLLSICLFAPSKDFRVNTRIWFFKLFSKLKPTQKELKQIEKKLFLCYEEKNLQTLKSAFSQPEIDVNVLKEFFVPELRYAVDTNLDSKEVVHHNKLPKFKGFTTVEAKCEILQAITTLNKHSKQAYIPVTKTAKAEHSIHSKLGGLPYLSQENDYPKCSNCGRHLQLLVQLNLEDIPENTEKGLIQLFFCTNPNTGCESKLLSKNSTTSLCRKVETTEDIIREFSNHDYVFPEKRITQFIEHIDYPHSEDYNQLDIELQVPDAIYDYMLANNIGTTNDNDKLFGYPRWLQSSAFSKDQNSDDRHLLFQLASNDNLPFMFGDSGIGYLIKITNNNNELSFNWQCF